MGKYYSAMNRWYMAKCRFKSDCGKKKKKRVTVMKFPMNVLRKLEPS